MNCAVCGERFEARGIKRFCSRACQLRARCEHTQANRRGDHVCRDCGHEFTVGYPDKRRFYCSAACSRRALDRIKKGIRRARFWGAGVIERVDPFTVLERDGWRCQRCGAAIPRFLRDTLALDAPQVDHKVPLQQGGPHTAENCECVCRRCKAATRARLLNDRLNHRR